MHLVLPLTSMVENTGIKDMQAEIHIDAEDIRRLRVTGDQFQKLMEAKTEAQESTTKEIKAFLQQLLLSSAHNHGSTTNLGPP